MLLPGDPVGVNWYKQRFWTATNICDLGQQGDLYQKDCSGNTKVLIISKLGHGFIQLWQLIFSSGLCNFSMFASPICQWQTGCWLRQWWFAERVKECSACACAGFPDRSAKSGGSRRSFPAWLRRHRWSALQWRRQVWRVEKPLVTDPPSVNSIYPFSKSTHFPDPPTGPMKPKVATKTAEWETMFKRKVLARALI